MVFWMQLTMNSMTPDVQHRGLTPLQMIPTCQYFGGEADGFPPVDIVEDPEEFI
jgi:hypothetical protein